MATKYQTGSGKKDFIVVQALTFGYMSDIEDGIIEEDLGGAILDATGISEDDLRKLRRNQITELWEIVKKETYPELYNEDGSEKDIEALENPDDKKKSLAYIRAKLIRNNHLDCRSYRMSFIGVVLDEIADDINEKLRYNSLSTRLSKLEADDFTKFMEEIEPKNQTEKVIVDHEAQMQQAMQG